MGVDVNVNVDVDLNVNEMNNGNSDQHIPSNSNSQSMIRVHRTSFLRETAPMYVMDQDTFLNGMIEISTNLSPHLLLKRLKHVESMIGRDLKNGKRWGPRPIDLDIVYYDIQGIGNDDGIGGGGGGNNNGNI